MSFRGGRDRARRDYPSRSEEKSHHGRSSAPPSRHLWVGNLSHTLTERALSNHFREFGELESVAFQPGRSYAFINFIDEGAAFAAYEALQGFILVGNALRIEFTKADRSSHEDDYLQRRDEPRSSRGSPFPQRDSRNRHVSSDPVYHDDNKSNSKNSEPSEVLWVGFPQSLKVDEDSFWKAFSPFGEINKISAFPGRTYAFIRFKHLNSACRAKEALSGKLFGNPRVHICFARSESGPSNGSRNLPNDPPSPRARPYGRQGSSENFRHDRYHEPPIERIRRSRSPRFSSNGPDDAMRFDRKSNRPTSRNVPFDQRFQEVGPDVGLPRNTYGRRSPPRDRSGNFRDFPPQNFPQQGPLYNDEWDLPEDDLVYHGPKKLKSSTIPPEPELPEYPFSDHEQVKHVLPRVPDFSQLEMLDNNNLSSGHFGYRKPIPDPPVNIPQAYVERGGSRNAAYDTFQAGPVPLPQKPVEWKRPTPEPQQPPASDEWKWEGIIAKGGTPICRARCFPVGKILDMILPEFLDCTARTSLDMLSKHYYQAASSWVVFFVPESDADMGFYNEFMNYLGEKQRAAVAKLDDETTLFLVPPSDFSEKVLKVPGKLSISGVILRLDQHSPTLELPLPPHPERPDPYSEPPFASPSGPYQPFANLGKPPAPPIPDHMLYHPRNPPRSTNDSGVNRPTHETSSSSYRPGSPTIPQDQLAQLASFLGSSRQLGTTGSSTGDEFRPDRTSQMQMQMFHSPNNNSNNNNSNTQTVLGSEHLSTQYHRQMAQFQQQQVAMPQREFSGSGQSQSQGQEEGDADPQKRLQATLELAATLLKQIQQGKT